jgi:hypothetical protein
MRVAKMVKNGVKSVFAIQYITDLFDERILAVLKKQKLFYANLRKSMRATIFRYLTYCRVAIEGKALSNFCVCARSEDHQ